MRWMETHPEHGARRQRTFFAIFPVVAEKEWRWLEWVTLERQFSWVEHKEWGFWFPLRFVDPPAPE